MTITTQDTEKLDSGTGGETGGEIEGGSLPVEWGHDAGVYGLRVGKLANGMYHPYVLKDDRLVISFGGMRHLADARRAVKSWYHDQVQDLEPGGVALVPIDLLEPHPINPRIYYSGAGGEERRMRDVTQRVEELKDAAETGVRYERTVKVNPLGLIISGNIHWYAAQQLDDYYIMRCEVKELNRAQEIQAIVLENVSKVRSQGQQEAEALAIFAAQKVLAQRRRAWANSGRTTQRAKALADRGRAAQRTVELLKTAGVTYSETYLQKLAFLDKQIEVYEKEDPPLATALVKLKEKSLEAAHQLLKDVPETHRIAVAEKAITEDLVGGGRNKKSIKKIYVDLAAQEAKTISIAENPWLPDLFAIATARGDEPESNTLTPSLIVDLLREFYTDPFVDVFAELEKANIPAKKHISILEDAYEVDWGWDDGLSAPIYAYIPENEPAKTFARLKEQLLQKKVSEAVIVANSAVLHNVVCQTLVDDFNPVIIPWKRGHGVKRLEFAPASYLQYYKPEAEAENKDVVIMYIGDRAQQFKSVFGFYGSSLVSDASTHKRVFSYWQDTIASWEESEMELRGAFLRVRELPSGLWEVIVNGQEIPGLTAKEQGVAKAMAIAYVLCSSELSPFVI